MRPFFAFAAILALFPCFGSSTIDQMTLEEKVGQLLVAHFYGEEANQDAHFLIREVHIGGIIYYNWANGLKSPHQVRLLSDGLQAIACENRLPIPLWIVVDQEGGQVTRLTEGFTLFPGNRALAMAGKPEWAEESALAMGSELKAVGVNLNLSPVVDVNSNPRNPVIGIRSFGEDPETVIRFAKPTLEGYRQAGIVSSLKHFPGHGDVGVDSHFDLPTVKKPLEELKVRELLPFAQLASECDTILTGHILVPALDSEKCATLSPKILSYLREEIGFPGIIIADSLVMEGLLKCCSSIEEAAIQAIAAGSNLLLLGGKQLIGADLSKELSPHDVQRIHLAIVDAVKSGRLSEKRIEESVSRLIQLKERSLDRSEAPSFNKANHEQLAKKIAAEAIRTIKHEFFFIPSLSQRSVAIFAPDSLEPHLRQLSIPFGKESSIIFFSKKHPSSPLIEEASKADILCLFSSNAWNQPEQEAFLQQLIEMGKPVILIAARDPIDVTLFPGADLILATYSPTPPSLLSALETIKKRGDGFSFTINERDAIKIADKIWYNECGGSIDYLIHWNKGENFGSFGIGHFIWYPANYRGPFEEIFPEFLHYLMELNLPIPEWLREAEACPWNSREEFYHNINSPQMKSLRQFLVDTRKFQAIFLAKRFERRLPEIVIYLPNAERENAIRVFYKLANTSNGLYALVDYLNFKGAGTSPKERYNGQGWGLLQVLQRVSPKSPHIVYDFAESAKELLILRVQNSPNPDQEGKWLSGWLKRVETYKH